MLSLIFGKVYKLCFIISFMVAQPGFEDRIEKYFYDLRDFLDGRVEESPCFRVDSSDGVARAFVYVDRQLARKIIRDSNIYKKHFGALRHGYVEDRKGLNGIRDIHENDGRVYVAAVNALSSLRGRSIMAKHSLNPLEVKAVKIVAHDPSLRRLYGFMDTNQGKVVLIGVEHYK